MEKKAVIFDLDGTLWDSSDGVAMLWNKVIKDLTDLDLVLTGKDIADQMGKPMYAIGEALFPMLPQEMQRKIIDLGGEAENDYFRVHGAKLYDALEETLEKLMEKYSLYVVSNCQDGYIEAFIEAHHMEKYFEDIESGRTGLSKADNIKLIMERNQITSAVYVGDTSGDQTASKAAGIPFIFATYGLGNVESYEYHINALPDLITVTDQVFADMEV